MAQDMGFALQLKTHFIVHSSTALKKLLKWALSPEPGSGAHHAARFVLTVWNLGPWQEFDGFDFHEAFGKWDKKHRAAFLAWASAPWWA